MTWNGKPDRLAAIDPGIDGALLLIDPGNGAVVAGVEMPIVPVERATRTKAGKPQVRHLIDGPAVKALLLTWRPGHLVIEVQGARPEQGLASTFTTGRGFGLLEGIAVGLGIPYSLVQPGVWRASIKAPGGKIGSWIACGRLAPDVRLDLEKHFRNKVSRIAGADCWGMLHAYRMENPARSITNEDFFA
jgi:crossover junction endodeoxyribonuclease RuvC